MAGTVISVHVPRMELLAAACAQHLTDGGGYPSGEGGARHPARDGGPCALAPEPGGAQLLGEVSPSAEALGLRAGMALGGAFARLPGLQLLSPDPDGAAQAWERMLSALEAIGAQVESERVGSACFQSDGLHRLHGGLEGVLAAVRAEFGRLARRAAAAEWRSLMAACARVRMGAGASRFHALLACRRARSQRALAILPSAGELGGGSQACCLLSGIVAERYIASLPVELLALHPAVADLAEPLRKLGIESFGEFSALGRSALSDRFGRAGLLAWELVAGHGEPLRVRAARASLEESIELDGPLTGQALEHATGILLDRLLARPERRGRTLRVLVIAAALAGGGSWRQRIALREATALREPIMLACSLRLRLLPAPARRLTLRAESLAAAAGRQLALLDDGRSERADRVREAADQVRAGAGTQALLRIVPLEESSRAFERRFMLTPRI